ncbi:hypothetical protein SESBI_38961 [Sesbania bispinosa]|nr:hypothetical protein SESBI_38961 [Sesbania bispinosa]
MVDTVLHGCGGGNQLTVSAFFFSDSYGGCNLCDCGVLVLASWILCIATEIYCPRSMAQGATMNTVKVHPVVIDACA